MPFIAIIISILFALFFIFFGSDREVSNPLGLGIVFTTFASLLMLVQALTLTTAMSPLQASKQLISPRVIKLFKGDRTLKSLNILISLLAIISFAFALDTFSFNLFNKRYLIPVWFIMLGISVDAFNFSMRRIYGYLDPFFVISTLAREANSSIQNDQEAELCNSIDGLAEVGVKALSRHSTAVCNEVGNELQKIVRLIFESSKSISHHVADETQKTSLESPDKVSYTLFFLLQRLEMLNDKAVELKLEPASSNLITVVGKIVISSAKYDLSMTSYPLHFLGRLALKAQRKGLIEVGQKAVCTLVEVAKIILDEIDVTYLELQETFFTLTTQLNEISKEMFRQDKTINIKILKQPFLDLKALFSSEKMAAHQDTPAIMKNIDLALGEYEALEAVMKTIPPIPKPVVESDANTAKTS